jgi:hypothetical protein
MPMKESIYVSVRPQITKTFLMKAKVKVTKIITNL